MLLLQELEIIMCEKSWYNSCQKFTLIALGLVLTAVMELNMAYQMLSQK